MQQVVAHVFAPAEVGGLESVVAALLTGAVRRGEPRLAVALMPVPGETALLRHLRTAGVEVRALHVGRRRYGEEVRAVAAALRERGVDVVHTHGYHADLVGLFAARRCALPRVTTVHGFTGGGPRNMVYEGLQCLSYHWFDRVLAVSESVAQRLKNRLVPASRIEVVRNAWGGGGALPRAEARAGLGLPADGPVIGWVGRLSAEKGPDVLLEAVRLVPGVTVAMVGEGALRAELEATARRRGLPVVWCGAVQGAGRYMPAFDVLAISSRTEGIPIVLFEAMAAGVPIVATRVGGVPEVLDERSALLVAPEDAPALAQALRQVLGQRAEAAERTRVASEVLAGTFAADAWLDRHARLYQSLVSEERRT